MHSRSAGSGRMWQTSLGSPSLPTRRRCDLVDVGTPHSGLGVTGCRDGLRRVFCVGSIRPRSFACELPAMLLGKPVDCGPHAACTLLNRAHAANGWLVSGK